MRSHRSSRGKSSSRPRPITSLFLCANHHIYLQIGVKVLIKNNYILGEKRNLSLPGAHLNLPIMTERDELDISDFACKNHDFITMVAISLTRTAENIETVRAKLDSVEGGENMKIIAKIENLEGMET